MIHKIKVLKFDKTKITQPVVCELSRKFDLTFSILKAKVMPRQEGLLIMEMIGRRKNYEQALQFLAEQGVSVQGIEQEIRFDAEKCTQCGACVAFCPSNALRIDDRKTMEVVYYPEDCIGCEICLTGCGPRAMTVSENYAPYAMAL